MKYQDSIKQAQQKMALTAKQLAKWHLPANPINYAVCYEFITGQNKSLLIAIKQQLLIADTLDSFFIDDIYREHILGQSKFRDEIISDIFEIKKTLSENIVTLLTSIFKFFIEKTAIFF